MPGQPSRRVLVIGNLDGVHIGHQALLRQAVTLAQAYRARGMACESMAMFFDPHPAQVLAPKRAADMAPLTTIARRSELLQAHGIERVFVQPFDKSFSRLSPEAFVRDVLIQRLHACAVVVGEDFRFAHQRQGNTALLRRLGDEYVCEVHTLPAVEQDGAKVSSSTLRALLKEGQVEQLLPLLGRYFSVEGKVVQGAQRGAALGFPTANLSDMQTLMPADGVYAVVVQSDALGQHRLGVANLGPRPTVDAQRAFEVHLLDTEADLYNHSVRVWFIARLRGQQRFDSLDQLKMQIANDCEHARDKLTPFEAIHVLCL